MKVGIGYNSNSTWLRYGDKRFEKIKEFGYSAIDYGLSDTSAELYNLNEKDLMSKVFSERTNIENAGLFVSQVHGPWRYPPQDCCLEDRLERMEKMKKSILITSLLGCKYWVVHPLMPFGTSDLRIDKEQETWEINMDFFTELLSYAKSQNVVICLENMPMLNFSIATPIKILEFVKTINDDNFKVCLDTGHVNVFSYLSIEEQVLMLKDYVKVLHVHDNFADTDAHLWPTKGSIRWKDFVNALKKIKFDGVFSLETAPSASLDDENFEKECMELCSIAKSLVENY